MPTGKVFLNYRRDDSEGYTGRLYDHLNTRFPGRIFRDISGLQPGDDFVDALEREGVSCAALIAVIGKHWLGITDANGKRRLDDPNDILRREIVNALKRNVLVIPVLVGGAAMPAAEELPPDIAFLARRQALTITEYDFEHDIQRLFRVLERALCVETPTRQELGRTHEDERSLVELRSLLSQGRSASAREDWVNAVQTFQAAVSLDPTNPEAAAELRNAISQRDRAAMQERGHREVRSSELQTRGPSRMRWLIAGVVGAVVILGIIGAMMESGSKPAPATIVDGPGYQQATNAQPTNPQPTPDVKKQSTRMTSRAAAPSTKRALLPESDNTTQPEAEAVRESPAPVREVAAEFRPPGRWQISTASGISAVMSLFPDGSFNVMSGAAPLSAGRWSYSPQNHTVVLVGVNNVGAYFSANIIIQSHDAAGFHAYDNYMGAIVLSDVR